MHFDSKIAKNEKYIKNDYTEIHKGNETKILLKFFQNSLDE